MSAVTTEAESRRRPLPPNVRPLTGAVVAYAACYIVAIIALPEALIALDAPPQWRTWGEIVAYVLLGSWGMWVFRSALAASWAQTRTHPWKTNGLIALGLVLIVAGNIASTLVLNAVGYIETAENQLALERLVDVVPAAVLILVLAILGPMVEEFLFRETILARLRTWVPTTVGVIVSTLLFAGLHLHGLHELPAALPYATSGLILAVFFVVSRRNLVVSVGIHVLTNVLGFAMAFASV